MIAQLVTGEKETDRIELLGRSEMMAQNKRRQLQGCSEEMKTQNKKRELEGCSEEIKRKQVVQCHSKEIKAQKKRKQLQGRSVVMKV